MPAGSSKNLKIVYVSTRDLIPYARNARTHSDAQVNQIAGSIREFGFINPVVIDDAQNIIAGHCRVLAAERIKMAKVPTINVDYLTNAQKQAYVIADNKLALNAGWDEHLLAIELSELSDLAEFDVELTGFSLDEIAELLALDGRGKGLTDPDAVPDAPESPVSVLGDVWVLGQHRLVCGDSTEAGTVNACLNGVVSHLMVTDPPYGVEYNPKWRADAGINNNKAKMGEVINDDQADWRGAWALVPGDVAYVWSAPGPLQFCSFNSLHQSGFELRQQIIWVKERFALGRGHYHYQHEPCWYVVRKGATGHWAGDRKQTSVWQINARDDSGHGHSTQKPVECMRRPILNNSNPGQAVYDPFVGSGTTIIAAEMEGRICHAIELNPEYVDIAIERWQNFTGQQAIHENGTPFDASVAA